MVHKMVTIKTWLYKIKWSRNILKSQFKLRTAVIHYIGSVLWLYLQTFHIPHAGPLFGPRAVMLWLCMYKGTLFKNKIGNARVT